jgi:diguanylate cyclase (GGDEF)-like protein
MLIENNTSSPKPLKNDNGIGSLQDLLLSENLKKFFQTFSHASDFHFSIYDRQSNIFSTISENPICKITQTSSKTASDCPSSCLSFISESFRHMKPSTHTCYARITLFAVPLRFLDEKFVIVGKNGFTSYENFLEFLKIARAHKIYEIPVSSPLKFHDEHYIKNISSYLFHSINYLVNNIQERHKLIEKIERFTSLSGSKILERIAKNTDSLFRYIVDTIEYILSPASVAVLVLNKQSSLYTTMCVAGKYQKSLLSLTFNTKDSLIKDIFTQKDFSVPAELPAIRFLSEGIPDETRSLFLFPLFLAPDVQSLIVILKRELSREDTKIIHALRDYVESALKNIVRSISVNKRMDSMLTSILDSSASLASLLDQEKLLQTIVDKSAQLTNAEKGSLMLLNQDTSELLVEAKTSPDDILNENMKTSVGEGIAGKVLKKGVSLLVENLEKDPRINQKNKPRYKTKSFLCIPLKIEDRVIGVLNISDKITGDAFNDKDLRIMQSFGANASIALERCFLYKKTEELKELSIKDSLTGVFNRRYFSNRLSEEISRFNRYKQPFSILMIDIDEFKKHNDTHGHLIGDKILKILGATILSSLRNLDIAARYGGDEFILLLSQTPKIDAVNIANRIKENIEKAYLSYQEELTFSDITVSIGLASFPDDASSATELIEKADQALYLAKKSGRNRLVYL